MTEIMKITIEEAIQQLEFDRAMIRFDATTGEEISLEMLKSGNQDNYLTYVADGVAIKALEEVQKYREIGTVDECQEAVDRREAKPVKNRKILRDLHGNLYDIQGDCPNCGCERLSSISTYWCGVCGQHLKYDENLEEIEDGRD